MAATRNIVLAASWLGLCWAGLVGTGGVARAAIYIVDAAAPNAADTNLGSEQEPFNTVQRAANVAKPGDTIYVMACRHPGRVACLCDGRS